MLVYWYGEPHCCLSVRKSMIHLHVETGSFRWESVSLSWDKFAKVHKQNPGIGTFGVQMLEDKVMGHVYSISCLLGKETADGL